MRNSYEIWVPEKDQLGYRARYDINSMDSKRTVCEIPIRLSWLRIKSSNTFLITMSGNFRCNGRWGISRPHKPLTAYQRL